MGVRFSSPAFHYFHMKLISLNIWGGHEYEALILFLRSQAQTTDIFCLQEVYDSPQALVSRGTHINILEDFKNIFPAHEGFFSPVQDKIDEKGAADVPSLFGHAMFIKKPLRVETNGFIFAYRERNAMAGDDFGTLGHGFQYARLHGLTILNVHGISLPGDKLDTEARLKQSQAINDFLKSVGGPKIVCGDFNLMPETESVKMLEKNMKNLIKEFGITETRGEINHRKYPADPQHFADYIFVSPEIKVKSLEVPRVLISDHLPLILEFSLN